MIKERNYKNNKKTIYECDRCKEEIEGSNKIYRVCIQRVSDQKTIKSVHLCPKCAKLFLYFVKKGVQKK